jgi:hypothetical protein
MVDIVLYDFIEGIIELVFVEPCCFFDANAGELIGYFSIVRHGYTGKVILRQGGINEIVDTWDWEQLLIYDSLNGNVVKIVKSKFVFVFSSAIPASTSSVPT